MLKLLAFATTDLETVISLADASQKRYAKAVAAGEIAAARIVSTMRYTNY
jgi:hypothetical protein